MSARTRFLRTKPDPEQASLRSTCHGMRKLGCVMVTKNLTTDWNGRLSEPSPSISNTPPMLDVDEAVDLAVRP